jgi:DNA-binding transcriptional regulator GbsR (MarR family)
MDRSVLQSVTELDALAIEIGKFIRYWGFKRVHGRVWTHIYLSSEPMDAGTLMKRLGVSKALMSLSLNDLLDFNVIHEGKRSSRGTQTYVANPQVIDVILEVLRRREKKLLAQIDASCKVLRAVSPDRLRQSLVNTARLDRLNALISEAKTTLEAMTELTSHDFSSWQELNEMATDKASLELGPEI